MYMGIINNPAMNMGRQMSLQGDDLVLLDLKGMKFNIICLFERVFLVFK
jgi:hypothetical protein